MLACYIDGKMVEDRNDYDDCVPPEPKDSSQRLQ